MAKDPNAPVVIATALTDAEAGIIASTLRERGVEARVIDAVGSVLSVFGPALNQPIQIVVRRCDADRAAAALREAREESIDIDWSQVDTGNRAEDPTPSLVPSRGGAALLFVGACLLILPVIAWMMWRPQSGSAGLFVMVIAAVVIGAPLAFIGLLSLLHSDRA